MMAYLDRDGVPIYYEVSGGPDGGVPLLLSHGFAASSQMWRPNIGPLSHGRPVITWDIRGHGRSGAPDDAAQYSQEASVADMAAVLDACGIERVVAAGLSLGGYLSLAFYQACPDRVAALVLCDTGPGYRNDQARQGWNDRAAAQAARLQRDGLAALGDSPEVRAAGHRSAAGLANAAGGRLHGREDPRGHDGGDPRRRSREQHRPARAVQRAGTGVPPAARPSLTSQPDAESTCRAGQESRHERIHAAG
jgi:pimeloyl-ACP methyl ester carboxylesterase